MTPRVWLFLAALVLAVPITWSIHRIAQKLGFLDPPWNAEHRERRTIVASLYALLLTLPLLFFGALLGWPRIWLYVGIVNALAALAFTLIGVLAARRLWRLRNPRPEPVPEPGAPPAPAIEGEDAASESPPS
jgi:cytochrome b561